MRFLYIRMAAGLNPRLIISLKFNAHDDEGKALLFFQLSLL